MQEVAFKTTGKYYLIILKIILLGFFFTSFFLELLQKTDTNCGVGVYGLFSASEGAPNGLLCAKLTCGLH